MYYVYQHIRPDTGEVFYIGKGLSKSKRAWEKRNRTKLWNSIVSKNEGIFKVEILYSNLTCEDCNSKETELIKMYGREVDKTGKLVNFQPGGDIRTGYKLSEDQKIHLSNLLKGNQYAKGFKHSKESRERMSQTRKGRTTSLKGKKLLESTKQKMSISHLGNTSNTGKIYINNGIKSRLIPSTSSLPDGWKRGRIITWKLTGRPKKQTITNK